MLRGAMRNDRVAVENPREGFEEGCGADQRQRRGVIRSGLADRP